MKLKNNNREPHNSKRKNPALKHTKFNSKPGSLDFKDKITITQGDKANKPKENARLFISRFAALSPEFTFLEEQKLGTGFTTSYVPEGSKIWRAELAASIATQLGRYADSGRLIEIGIRMTSDPVWESTGHDGRVSLPLILKAKRGVQKAHSRSISRVVLGQAPDDGRSGFVNVPVIVTLYATFADDVRVAESKKTLKRSVAQPRGPRPILAPLTISASTDESIGAIVAQFANAGKTLRQEGNSLGEETLGALWRDSRLHRALAIEQFESVVPAQKAVFASDDMAAVVEHALVKPAGVARAAKKREGTLNREEVADLWWGDAYSNPGSRLRPLYVKL